MSKVLKILRISFLKFIANNWVKPYHGRRRCFICITLFKLFYLNYLKVWKQWRDWKSMTTTGIRRRLVKSVASQFPLYPMLTSDLRWKSRVPFRSSTRRPADYCTGIYSTDYPRLLDSCGRQTRKPECKANIVEN